MKHLLIIFALTLSLVSSAQAISGTATYLTESAAEISFDSTSGIPLQQQAAINERIRKAMAKEFQLTFNAAEGLYRQVPKLAAPNAGKEVEVIGAGQGMDGGLYKNTRKGLLVETRDVFGKLFLVKDSLVRPDWTILKERKEIQGYTCVKAALTTPRGTTTAWFSPEIPVNHGPGDYWGLPGFILRVNNGRMTFTCTELSITSGTTAAVDPPKKGKVVTLAECEAIYLKKVKEMQRMTDEDAQGNR